MAHHRGTLCFGRLDHGLQGIGVPGFKVTNGVRALPGGGQELGQGHYRHAFYLSTVLKSMGV
jgi:hypothetical protein